MIGQRGREGPSAHRGPQARSAPRGLPTYPATRKTRPRRSLFVLGVSGSVRVGVCRGWRRQARSRPPRAVGHAASVIGLVRRE
jgi:hypothetical protein